MLLLFLFFFIDVIIVVVVAAPNVVFIFVIVVAVLVVAQLTSHVAGGHCRPANIAFICALGVYVYTYIYMYIIRYRAYVLVLVSALRSSEVEPNFRQYFAVNCGCNKDKCLRART